MSSRCRADVFFALVALFVPLLACGVDLSPPKKTAPAPVEIEEDEDGLPKKKAVPKSAGVIDLGTAVFPNGTPAKGSVSFTFDVPPKHKLGYRLSDEEQKAISSFYSSFAASVGFKRVTAKSFQWSPPPGCPPDMSCVYKKLIGRTHDDVLSLAKRFKQRADANKLDALHVADLALAYVQTIPYEIPNEPFGLKAAPLVVTTRKGDCDSKSLLLYMLLNQLGIEAVILSSKAHAHTMVGIPLPTQGTTFRWKSRKYAFAETTAKSPIGYLPPDLSSPNDWQVELSP
jgi:hypothetical protein